MEVELVQRKGIPFEPIPAAGVHGVGLSSLPGNVWRLGRGVRSARQIVQRFDPQVLFFTGGYVGIPVAIAGWGLPKVVFVPDLEPALALRWIGQRANTIAVIAEESRAWYSAKRNIVVTGYPIRPELRYMRNEEARRLLDLKADGPVILVFGGSRGARSINEALWVILADLLRKAEVVHLTGTLDWGRATEAMEALPADLADRYKPFRYLHDEKMGAALASATVAVSRAGAATLGEYPHYALPSILVPYPHAWRYQKVNADYMTERGAAVQLADENLGQTLLPEIEGLLRDVARLDEMATAAKRLSKPGAAKQIAEEIERLTEEGGGRG